MRRTLLFVAVATTLLVASAGISKPRNAVAPFRFSIAKVSGQLGGEPSIAAGKGGWMYVTYPGSPGMAFSRSKDNGARWSAGAIADTSSGDDTVNVDSTGAVYQSNLNSNLQVDVFKSFDHGSHWPQKGRTAATTDSSNQPFRVDRPWSDVYVPKGKKTSQARVYVQHHDFGPSMVWVNSSIDGGRTFSDPVNVVTSPQALAATVCNSSPAGIKVAPAGPHAGRIYAAWLAADPASSVATGCNYTQLDTFHTIWVAWSDDEGKTWANHLVLDAGIGHDAAAFWGDLAIDRKGNPYIAVSVNIEQEWDAYVLASFDGGTTWNGSTTGAGNPFKVNADTGTHFFPAIDAGDPGEVVVAYLATKSIVPTLPYGKPAPGGDANAQWHVFVSQTLSLRSSHPVWKTSRATTRPMHVGDVCTLGLFCIPTVSDRNLLDFIDVALDPAGRAHVAYTDDADRNCICVANQISGPVL